MAGDETLSSCLFPLSASLQISPIRPISAVPMTASASGSSRKSSSLYRWARQPATTIFAHLPCVFIFAASRIASMDSSLADSMNPQVFTTMTSASDLLRRDLEARAREHAQHLFGINLVLGAAEADHSYFV